MDDRKILQMYFDRNTEAISVTSEKYQNYCKRIAKNILGNDADADECVNDTYFKAWNSIPPHCPEKLSLYLGKITRNLSFDKYRNRNASKRGGGEITLVLEELSECVSGQDTVENAFDRHELISALNSFLDTLSADVCDIFVLRYWYAVSVGKIAKKLGKTSSGVSVILYRTRNKLKNYLSERGFKL